LITLRQRSRAGRGRLLQAAALGFQPALELGRVRDEKPFQQCTRIQVERLLQLSNAERALEGGDVARYLSEVQADLLVAPARDGVAAQRVAYHVQRLAQRRAGMLLIELRPKQRQQRVAAVEGLRGCGGEVGEEREASGLPEQAPHFTPVDRKG